MEFYFVVHLGFLTIIFSHIFILFYLHVQNVDINQSINQSLFCKLNNLRQHETHLRNTHIQKNTIIDTLILQ